MADDDGSLSSNGVAPFNIGGSTGFVPPGDDEAEDGNQDADDNGEAPDGLADDNGDPPEVENVRDLTDEMVAQLKKDLRIMEKLDKGRVEITDQSANSINTDDETVLNHLSVWKYTIDVTGKLPGEFKMGDLENVPYNPDSEFAKRMANKKETYYTKLQMTYPIGSGVTSKYVGVRAAIIDLLPRPLTYGDKRNTYGAEYVAVYFPEDVLQSILTLVNKGGYNIDSSGLTIDKGQKLVAMNCSYATDDVPTLTIYRKRLVDNADGERVMVSSLDQDRSIEEMYIATHKAGGVLFRGYAFGEFGVSKQVAIGAPAPPKGSTLKLTFKLIGFHVQTRCVTVRAIKSKAARPKKGI